MLFENTPSVHMSIFIITITVKSTRFPVSFTTRTSLVKNNALENPKPKRNRAQSNGLDWMSGDPANGRPGRPKLMRARSVASERPSGFTNLYNFNKSEQFLGTI
jgi:hypothetical protein